MAAAAKVWGPDLNDPSTVRSVRPPGSVPEEEPLWRVFQGVS